MEVHHPPVNVVGDIVHDAEEMYVNHETLADAHRPPHCLVNHGGIPVLGQEQDAATEL
jgi:hypothetical protein